MSGAVKKVFYQRIKEASIGQKLRAIKDFWIGRISDLKCC